MRRILAVLILAALAVGCQSEEALRHAGLGHLALDRGDLEAALKEFEEAIQLDDTLATAYCGVGDVYRQQGKMDKAVAPYQQAVQAMPFEFAFHFRLGTAFQALERDKEAAKTYEAAIPLDPDNPPVHINLGVVYFRLGMGEADHSKRSEMLEKGRTYAERAVDLAPDHGFAWSNLGALYDALGDSYRAIGAYRKSIEIDPNQAPVHVNLGTAYLIQGRLD
jgi:Flp pilus assembly protein TadD